MLSVLADKVRKKPAVVNMLTNDPELLHIKMDGGDVDVVVRLPPRQRLGSDAPILPPLGFTADA